MVAEPLSSRPATRRRRANLHRILDAALRIVAQEGFDRLTMQRLADAAHYTPGALYRYFQSKDSLVVALILRLVGELTRQLQDVKNTEKPLQSILDMAGIYVRYSAERPNEFAMLALLFGSQRFVVEDDERVDEIIASMTGALEPVASMLASAGLDAAEPTERPLILFGALHGVLQMRKQARRAPDLIDVDRLSAALVRDLLTGWGAPTEELLRAGSGDTP